MNEIINKLIEKFGETPGVTPLYKEGWKDISQERFVAAKDDYCTGDSWPEGFSELLDNRIVYRGYFGNILLAPFEFQPSNIANKDERERLYRAKYNLPEDPEPSESSLSEPVKPTASEVILCDTERQSKNLGQYAGVVIRGKTYEIRERIRQTGAVWWAEKKVWLIPLEITSEQFDSLEELIRNRDTYGLGGIGCIGFYENPAEYDDSPDPRLAYQ